MKTITVGNIFSICVPSDAVYENDVANDCIIIHLKEPQSEIRFFLFQEIKGGHLNWCNEHLEMHVREMGPPFTTNVQEIEGDSWHGYQAVTGLDQTKFLINRVIASKTSDYGARIEFHASKGDPLEAFIETVEAMEFLSPQA